MTATTAKEKAKYLVEKFENIPTAIKAVEEIMATNQLWAENMRKSTGRDFEFYDHYWNEVKSEIEKL